MSKIFNHIISEEYDPRIEDITSYIIKFFESKLQKNSIFFILDPYIEPYAMIYKPLSESRIDNSPYAKIIKSIFDVKNSTIFKIITDMDMKQLKDQLPQTNEEYYYANFFLEQNAEKIEIIKYPSKSKSRTPQRLHDRWLILKSESYSGLHLGPSLDNYQEKDFTITCFDNESAKVAGERCENIWTELAGWIT